MMKRFQLPIPPASAGQEIYFTPSHPAPQSWGMTLFCAGLLLTTLSACLLPVVSQAATTELQPRASRSAAVTHTERRVFQQGLPHYHWHFDCPLAAGSSARVPANDVAQKRRYMTKAQAEQQALGPCTYCLDLEMES